MKDEEVPEQARLLARAILAELGRLLMADDEDIDRSQQQESRPEHPQPPPPVRWSDNEWLDTKQAAARTGRHTITILRAAERGQLHGHQTKRRGRWSFKEKSVDAWIEGRSSIAACGCQKFQLNRRRPN